MQPFLFEISSEAGRKVGGIYTVLQSKSRYVKQAFEDRYLFIGFYDEKCAHDVKYSPPPKELEKAFAELAAEGIFCHWGKWIQGHDTPIILVEARNFAERPVSYDDNGARRHDRRVNYVKFLLWKHYGIDSLMESSYDFAENASWGWAVGMLLEKLVKVKPYAGQPIVAQFHEWICGSALLYADLQNLPLAKVFTTHATVLGRSLAAGGVDVMAAAAKAPTPIEISEAYRLKVEGKHQLEMAAAKKSDVFTTVSETVGVEVKYILGREADVVTLNGMDFEEAEAESKVRDLAGYMRGELLQLAEACFTPYYTARYDNALICFISGRYEFTNKGFDIYIRAMGKLNERIKKKGIKQDRQVFAFIFAPSAVRGPKISVIKNYLLLDKIMEVLSAAPGAHKDHHPNLQARLDEVQGSLRVDLDTMKSGFIRDGDKPHINLYDLSYANDEIIRSCVAAGLGNAQEDAVKVLFYPTYLRPNDGLMNMSYYDVVSGMDVGIFPSRYEPFGYTPLEAGLKFNAAVSTDAAGFGRYLQEQVDLNDRGVKILHLGAKAAESAEKGADWPSAPGGDSGERAAEELADFLELLYYAHHSKLEHYKDDSYRLMHLFDWKILISNYLKAYTLAAQRKFGGGGKVVELRLPAQGKERIMKGKTAIVQTKEEKAAKKKKSVAAKKIKKKEKGKKK